jgi:hypothetical protein
MLGSIGKQKFTKALVLSGGASVIEVDIAHAPRHGRSRYSPLRLTRTALHVLAGFWPQPIQWIGVLLGAVSSLLAFGLGIYGVIFWIGESNFPGPLCNPVRPRRPGLHPGTDRRVPRPHPARRRRAPDLHDRSRALAARKLRFRAEVGYGASR